LPIRPVSLADRLLRWWYRKPLAHSFGRRLELLNNRRRNFQLLHRLGSHGSDVTFQFPNCVVEPERIHVGHHVNFSAFLHVWANGGVRIGSRVMIASHVAITTVTHDYQAPVMWGSLVSKAISIEDDVWIGAHAVILPGITIGQGAVVGAGSVVTRDVPPYAIVTGSPARALRFRDVARQGE
jgi:maltose O-acetyltransferase